MDSRKGLRQIFGAIMLGVVALVAGGVLVALGAYTLLGLILEWIA